MLGIALAAAASFAAAAPAAAERYEDGLAAYQRDDFAKSLKTLRPLAEKGDARAQYLLGRQYQFGQGVKADRAEAYYWYRRAEAKGHLEAKLFRQLLEKRWHIAAADKERGERKLAALDKPPARAAHSEAKPKAEKPPAQARAETPRDKTKPAAQTADRTKSEPVKPKIETTARVKPADPPMPVPAKAKTDTAQAKPPEKPAVVAARSTPADDVGPPAVLRGRSEAARPAPRPQLRDSDDDDSAVSALPADDPPPAETRTPITPPPSTAYAAPPDYPPAYGPGPPYYDHGPAPYYAPAAPPSWRGSVYYGPRPYYRPGAGYRPYGGYVHPGWRGYHGAYRYRGY